jgi:acyl-CoA oxidase
MPNTGLPGVPKIAVVMAELYIREVDKGVFPVVVHISDRHGLCPGASAAPLGEKSGYPRDNAMTTFTNVLVPKSSILLPRGKLSENGDFISSTTSKRERFLASTMELVQLGRLCLSAVGSDVLTAASFIAIKYTDQRLTFVPRLEDASIMEYRNHQRDVFLALAASCSSQCMVDMALDMLVTGMRADGLMGDEEVVFRIGAATKVYTSYGVIVSSLFRLCCAIVSSSLGCVNIAS